MEQGGRLLQSRVLLWRGVNDLQPGGEAWPCICHCNQFETEQMGRTDATMWVCLPSPGVRLGHGLHEGFVAIKTEAH